MKVPHKSLIMLKIVHLAKTHLGFMYRTRREENKERMGGVAKRRREEREKRKIMRE